MSGRTELLPLIPVVFVSAVAAVTDLARGKILALGARSLPELWERSVGELPAGDRVLQGGAEKSARRRIVILGVEGFDDLSVLEAETYAVGDGRERALDGQSGARNGSRPET